MMFRRARNIVALTALAPVAVHGMFMPAAAAGTPTWAMPWFRQQIIYPGEERSTASVLQEVEVTNPNLAGGYAKSIEEVRGMIIEADAIARPDDSGCGDARALIRSRAARKIRLVFSMGTMTISAAGSPLEDGFIGQVVRARNMIPGSSSAAPFLPDGTMHVAAK